MQSVAMTAVAEHGDGQPVIERSRRERKDASHATQALPTRRAQR